MIGNDDYEILSSKNKKIADTRSNLNKLFGEKYPDSFRPEHIKYHIDEPDELAIINYTSGTTSKMETSSTRLPRSIRMTVKSWSRTRMAAQNV